MRSMSEDDAVGAWDTEMEAEGWLMLGAREVLLDEEMLVLEHAAQASYRLGAKVCVRSRRCSLEVRRCGPEPRKKQKKSDSFGKGSLRKEDHSITTPAVSFPIYSVPETSSVLIRALEAQKDNLISRKRR